MIRGDRPLHTVATARAGDKGDASIIAVHPKPGVDFRWLRRQLGCNALARHFGVPTASIIVHGPTTAGTIIITIEGRLYGGVTRSPSTDPHGKTLSFHLLEMGVESADD